MQKTAYERRISDWSSDVCSSDLSGRCVEILNFTTNLEHIGDIIDKNLMELASKKIKNHTAFSAEGMAELQAFHARIVSNLALAMNVFASGVLELARQLLRQNTQRRELERRSSAARRAGTECVCKKK